MNDTFWAWLPNQTESKTFKAVRVARDQVDFTQLPTKAICVFHPDTRQEQWIQVYALRGSINMGDLFTHELLPVVVADVLKADELEFEHVECLQWDALIQRGEFPVEAMMYANEWVTLVRGEIGSDISLWDTEGIQHMDRPYATLLIRKPLKAGNE